MLIEIVGPAGHKENFAADNRGLPLSALLGGNIDHVSACFLNNRPQGPDWPQLRPGKSDKVALHLKSGTFGIASGTLAAMILQAVYGAIISTALSMIVMALTPKPKPPKGDSKRAEAFGIAGFNNTTGPGTPIPICYGKQRVFGHVVGSYTELIPDGSGMYGAVLYCMGDSGGDEYGSISEVQIDEIDVASYPGIVVDTRLGAMDQTVIPGFENISEVWYVGQKLPWDFNTLTGDPIVYQAHGDIDEIKIQIQYPGGLVYYNVAGDSRWATYRIQVEIKRASEGPEGWTIFNLSGHGNMNFNDGSYGFTGNRLGEFYSEFVMTLPEKNTWHLRFRILSLKAGSSNTFIGAKDGAGLSAVIYNVEEREYGTDAHPGYCLLGVSKIPGKQIKSLENMKCSALVEGKRVKVPDIYDDGPRELITNPAFDSPFDDNANWIDADTGTGNSGGAMFNGACESLFVGASGYAQRYQTISVSPGRIYRLSFTIPDASLTGQTGTVTAYAGGILASGDYTPGDHTLDFVSPTISAVNIILTNNAPNTHVLFRSIHCAPVAGGGSPDTMLLRFTRQRCWIVRDMMTHPICGMGSEIAEDEIDQLKTLWIEAQDYYDELVASQDGNVETRDYCDFILNEGRWDWEWVKAVAGEARGRIIPADLGWKYVIDRPGTPNLLYAEPGNIIDGSLNIEIAPPDKYINQVIAEFRDETDDYKPNVSQPISDPDITTSIVQEGLRYDTITRESEALRENMIVLKRSMLERRRWSFVSPQGGIVSEPLDLDYIAERQIGNDGAYSGILAAAGTTTTIYLPQEIILEDAKTYAVIIRHQEDNTIEYRTVSTASGIWAAVDVSTAFVAAPKAGDLFAIGVESVDHIITRAQELEIDDNGNVKQLRTEYIPAVYTADALPAALDRKNFNLTFAQPLPLRDANVVEKIVRMRDGSQTSILAFDVIAGLPTNTNLAQGPGSGTNTIVLAASEPSILSQIDLYRGAQILCRGVIRKITAYDPENRQATVDQDWGLTIVVGDQYTITWKRFSETTGFRVEQLEVPQDPALRDQYLRGTVSGTWTNLGTRSGLHWETNGRDQTGSYYLRFTPLNADGKENLTARIVKQIILAGDITAPDPPVSVVSVTWDKTVDVVITLQLPIPSDLAGVEVQIYELAILNVIPPVPPVEVILAQTRAGTVQNNAQSGTMIVRVSMTLTTAGYGDTAYCRARTIDFSNNWSAWVQGNQQVITAPP